MLATAVLMALILKVAAEAATGRARRVPWVAVALVMLAVAGLVTQTLWSGAMAALGNDPARDGWWRPLTSVFLQNGGVAGDLFNLVTLAAVATLAQWYWGGRLTVALFLIATVPLGPLFGAAPSTDPRNFAGSSGVTYFLGATLAGALLVAGTGMRQRLWALAVPALAAITWFAQSNGHGMLSVAGFAAGLVAAAFLHHRGVRADAPAERDQAVSRSRARSISVGTDGCVTGSGQASTTETGGASVSGR